LVHVGLEPHDEVPRPGDLAHVVITGAHPHHLTADHGLLDLRRTPGGDAWQTRQEASQDGAPTGVDLGMPRIPRS
ncbi:MAG: tRNA (N6-isopentenyl adenosine(37)-C2)-methylthiotransferase MiaB, partial [Cutibacterium granulosum]|nr:tRNA (N6-isopentenyl adenosine(37)-C2)-methylthiotransferase MiaB [Cutibacterium granulosum]